MRLFAEALASILKNSRLTELAFIQELKGEYALGVKLSKKEFASTAVRLRA